MFDHNFQIFNRSQSITQTDIDLHEDQIEKIVNKSSFLVVGAAGTIGRAVSKEIFIRNPRLLHLVDISENNLVETVRDLRSTANQTSGEFRTFCIDCGSKIFDEFMRDNKYDYVLNLSALKHVRSERDRYTLMRMLQTNILNSLKLHDFSEKIKARKYFCVSTDKAANPANLMGATKLIMEREHFARTSYVPVSMARFANVAFSDGSLLHGFKNRLDKKQPITAPVDIKRYFVTKKEAGQICLLSALFCSDGQILFPKLYAETDLVDFKTIAVNYLRSQGLEAFECDSEEEARVFDFQTNKNHWPCYFFRSDTTGEKPFEEFFTDTENTNLKRFSGLGVINYSKKLNASNILSDIDFLVNKGGWSKSDLINLIETHLGNFKHIEKGKNLDEKM